MEDPQQKIRDEFKRVFSNTTVGKTRKEAFKEIEGYVKATLPKGAKVGDVVAVWDSMTWKDKVKWFLLCRWPFKDVGDTMRDAVRNAAFYSNEYNRLTGGKHVIPTLIMPLYLYQNPKDVAHIVASLSVPVDHINVTIEV